MNDSPGPPGPAAEVDPLTVFDPATREPDLPAMTRIALRHRGHAHDELRRHLAGGCVVKRHVRS